MKKCTRCKKEKELSEFYEKKKGSGKYKARCKICQSQTNKEYYHKDIEKSRAICRKSRLKNRDKKLLYNKNYRNNPKTRIKYLESKRKYQRKNQDKFNKRTKEWRERNKNNFEYKMKKSLRRRIAPFLKDCSDKYKLIECDLEFYKEWIEFNSNLDNEDYSIQKYGLWEVDHLIPLASYNSQLSKNITYKQIKELKCNNWTNLKPLLKQRNLEKSDKIIKHLILEQELRVKLFLKQKGILTTFKKNVGVFTTTHFKKLIMRT